jgi:hypothetical protein
VHANPLRLYYQQDAFRVHVEYAGTPAIAPGTPTRLQVNLHNPHPDILNAEIALSGPAGWSTTPVGLQTVQVLASGEAQLTFIVQVDDPAHVQNSNHALLLVAPESRPAEPAIPIVFVGARCWQLWGPHALQGAVLSALDAPLAPDIEATGGDGWRVVYAPDNALPLPEDWTGILHARLYLYSGRRQEIRIGVPATCPRRLWLNGEALHTVPEGTLLRPNYQGDHASYVDATLEAPWNSVLVRYVRAADMPPFAAHLTLATTGLYHGLYDVGWTRLPLNGDGR